MAEPERVKVRQARAELADLLDRCKRKGERFIITRHGRPVAVLGPFVDAPKDDADDLARYFPAGILPG